MVGPELIQSTKKKRIEHMMVDSVLIYRSEIHLPKTTAHIYEDNGISLTKESTIRDTMEVRNLLY